MNRDPDVHRADYEQRQDEIGDELAERDTKERRDILRAKCFAMVDEIGLTNQDRHELSVQVVGQNGNPSWAQMTYAQLGKLADYLSGWTFIDTILRDRMPE